MHLKEETVSGFVSQTVKAPGARAGNRAASSRGMGHHCRRRRCRGTRETKPQPKLDSRERKGSSCVPLGSMARRELGSYQILLGHTTWPLSFSTFSTALTSLPMPHKQQWSANTGQLAPPFLCCTSRGLGGALEPGLRKVGGQLTTGPSFNRAVPRNKALYCLWLRILISLKGSNSGIKGKVFQKKSSSKERSEDRTF